MGSGGREHALAAALGRTADVVVCPGNAGMAALGIDCVGGPVEEVGADLWVIGPEAPLVDGLADRLRSRGAVVLGPGADGARLEGSKAWMKQVLASAGVPTPGYGVFDQPDPAVEFLHSLPGPWVVKTDGLAAGKGVLVADDVETAARDVREKLSGRAFGAAGSTVVIEEGLVGVELSLMALCDGTHAVPLAPAQDFKRIGEKDTGPNTGGMGAFSPVAAAGATLVEEVMELAVLPTLAALRERGVDYRGVLYAGLMLTASGPRVLEFNVRFGDPETQVLLPRWEGDVLSCLAAAAAGDLESADRPRFDADAAVCVVVACEGYPDAPRTGDRIEGVDDARRVPGVELFAAGVGAAPDGGLVTSGGRVLGVTARAPTLREARDAGYAAAGMLRWPGIQYRRDIAAVAAETEGVAAGAAGKHDDAAGAAEREVR